MECKLQGFFSSCAEMDFGAVTVSDPERDFCRQMNFEVISLCKSLPDSTQTDALLFVMKYYRIAVGKDLSIFSNYYVPAWSIIHWLFEFCNPISAFKECEKENARIAHSMALFLHPFDDHLNDGQLPVTHLTLLLRSQAWMMMNMAFDELCDDIEGGKEVLRELINDYYSSIGNTESRGSLDRYCDHFRKQMGTWLIVPVLIAKRIATNELFTDSIRRAYQSFGIAWRLLDDIKDIETDMMKGSRSSIYTCLSEDLKNHWDEVTNDTHARKSEIISDYIVRNRIVDRIKERICVELDSAAEVAEHYEMKNWSDELRSLSKPLKGRPNPL